ncbi:hypothetical protein [Bacillus pseudomycoides]|uniref:Uncharacterized protein n=1 Tax=Bacillus pseudomycoides TaxID=64104 RepID=A0A2B6KI54_9BACI|nr:hypothetical protein [Bacillus pseudomycoides]PDY44206.1 hypothetical protein CON79_26830 [Bacillus pseudomycoides]PEA81353.1 hypothetical protein CON99_23015 [Bacillus pseudomycoides]PED05429.1 hypothetical protein COO19_26610 [Bacillus pseudomycoides]PED69265.1 hypothetical protein CON97_26280 [Bacillus pseudomycoides]PEI36772.1 hypothetical protein CN620_23400 [Bacillus pseudomycoides]
MLNRKNDQIVIHIIKGSTIKKILILDLITGTGIYYIIKFISSSILIALIGSIVGTEGIKKIPKFQNNTN